MINENKEKENAVAKLMNAIRTSAGMVAKKAVTRKVYNRIVTYKVISKSKKMIYCFFSFLTLISTLAELTFQKRCFFQRPLT